MQSLYLKGKNKKNQAVLLKRFAVLIVEFRSCLFFLLFREHNSQCQVRTSGNHNPCRCTELKAERGRSHWGSLGNTCVTEQNGEK